MSTHDIVSPVVFYGVWVLEFANLYVLLKGAIRHFGRDNAAYQRLLRKSALFGAALFLVEGVGFLADFGWPTASVPAALLVVSLALWWFFGGGDDTKRRLRKLKEAFKGKRRTAPVTA
jgi:hypothetical protein